MQKIVDGLSHDSIALIIKNDQDIIQVGQNMLDSTNSAKKDEVCRERIRSVAKLLKEASSINANITQAADLLKPTFFDSVIEAARRVSRYNSDSRTYGAFSVALKARPALQDLIIAVRGKYVRSRKDDKVKEVDEFSRLLQDEWHIKVTATALQQQQELNWRSPQILPLTYDVVDFSGYLTKTEKDLKKSIQDSGVSGMSAETYRDLAMLTQCQLITFKRRRPGEVEALKIEDFKEQMEQGHQPIQDEIEKTLTCSEKISMARLQMLKVWGKRGRGVPILLTENMMQSVELLVQYNEKRDVIPKFVISRASDGAETPYRACDSMKKLTDEAKLKHPENVRCTKLRKHIATLSQLLNLNDHELEQLALIVLRWRRCSATHVEMCT